MACKRSGVRIPITPLPGQSIKFERPLLTCLRPHEVRFPVPSTWPSAFSQFSRLADGSNGRLSDPLRGLQEARKLEQPKRQVMGLVRTLNAMYSSGVPQRALVRASVRARSGGRPG